MAIQWDKVPGGRGVKYELRDNVTPCMVRLPKPLVLQVRAIRDQLRKDRKLINLKTYDKPMLPSINVIMIKALELMLLPDKKETDDDRD